MADGLLVHLGDLSHQARSSVSESLCLQRGYPSTLPLIQIVQDSPQLVVPGLFRMAGLVPTQRTWAVVRRGAHRLPILPSSLGFENGK